MADKTSSTVTIADIARELGVSKSTVSRVINGKGRIGEETRARIMKFVQEHNYTPNPIARGLAQKRTYNAAVVIPKDADRGDVPFFQNCLIGITETVSARGYDSLLAIEDTDDVTHLRRLVGNHKVDGVILTRLLENDESVKFLKDENVPFVVLGTTEDDSVYQIDSDQTAGCYDLTNLMIQHGCSKMTVLAGDKRHPVSRSRYKGFSEACSDNGVEETEKSVVWNLLSQEDVADVLPEVMKTSPQCLVCMDDVICSRVMYWLKQNGYKIPDDVQVISFYDSPVLESSSPAVTALSVNVQAMSVKAGNLLLDVIEGQICPHRAKVNYELKIRESSR